MKTKFNIKINAMQFTIQGQTIDTPEVHIDTELDATIGELKALYELQKQVLKETPVLAETFAKECLESLMRVHTDFEQKDKAYTEREQQERRIDEWFREYFLAPDVTEEAKKQFDAYFNQDKNNALVGRLDFFEMPFDKKDGFFKYTCDTCF